MDDKFESLLRLTSKLYYVDGLSQTEVADLTGISRPKVSRLLTRALNEGIVQITVEDYNPRHPVLEEALKQHFKLNNAIVIKLLVESSVESMRSTIGYLAAPPVSEWIYPNTIVGVSGSRSLYSLIQHMKPSSGTNGITAVQMMGNIGPNVSHYDSIELCRALATSFHGTYYVLNAPAFASEAQSYQILMAHQDVMKIWELYEAMQISFVGIGSLKHSSFIERGFIGPEEVEKLQNCGVVGEMCGRFYDRSGQECVPEYKNRVIGISLDELREKREVVAVTCGAERAGAVYAALVGGLIKSLVIDENGAKAVLKKAKAAFDPAERI